jgi:hypothetical protein
MGAYKGLDWNGTMKFGKYNGRTIRYIYQNDPQYLIWIMTETNVILSEEVKNDTRLRVLAKEANKLDD